MKIKKLIPIISALSAACAVTPAIVSCSGSVTLEIAYHDGKVYEYSAEPIEWTEGAISPEAAILNYFDAVKENKRILLDDFYRVITSDPERLNFINFLTLTVKDITTPGLQYRMSMDWNVNYNAEFELHPTCTYATNVSIKNFPFVAGQAIDPETLDPLEKGVQIRPLGWDGNLAPLKTDNDWEIEYYYEESSPVGLVNRTYVYNSETITSPIKYPIAALTNYILPMITYNSRYFQNVPVTE